jgi:N-acetylmuramoyl-L-alanine amidase
MLSPGSGARRSSTVLFLLLFSLLPAFARVHRSEDWADSQYSAASALRDSLDARPQTQRTRRQYQRVIEAYRGVYLGAPASGKADPSAAAVADLMMQMGRHFNDQKTLRAAVKQYEFLRREYPGSKSRFQALLSIGQIYKDDLNAPEQATDVFQEFVRRYPHNELAGDARQALTGLSQAASSGKKTAIAAQGKGHPERARDADDSDKSAASNNVSSNNAVSNHIVSNNGETGSDGAKGAATTVSNLTPAKITAIRYTPIANGARVVIDLGGKDLSGNVRYNAQRLSNPDRIFFTLFDAKLPSSLNAKNVKADGHLVKTIRAANFKPGQARVVLEVEDNVEFKAAFSSNLPHRLVIDLQRAESTAEASAPKTIADTDDPDAPAVTKAAVVIRPDSRLVNTPDDRSDDTDVVVPEKTSVKHSSRNGRLVAQNNAVPIREAQPTAEGDRSLIRALGLKIGKIVIDPGHGGHDTGTIGPHGLLEKDLVLDVSRRLGKLLQSRLGANVVYTRSDDTFIPLGTRTAIANQEQADLFISVHANSSHDQDARGVETYYLNFTSSPEALEVAARENAGSDKSIHELQDLVKTIALKEKIEESREFASDVETALHSGLAAKNPAIRDRGVKKAPFIVLIGANMPSILAEISFVSNPSDERKLFTPAYRQRIAESLYKGISKYVSGLSGIKVASSAQRDPQQ